MSKLITDNLIKNGFYKFKLNKKNYQILKKIILNKISGQKKTNLKYIHKIIPINKLNNLRLSLFKNINKNEKFKNSLYNSAKYQIEACVGSEICCSDINLSIQYPGDQDSLLSMHTDFFSGESIFQANLWVPFMNVKKTQSMFIINPTNSIKILKKIKNNKKIDFQEIEKKYHKLMKWIPLNEGEGMIFTPNCLHGNVINKERETRISINIRYKNLFSPYSNFKNEKKIGTFYKPYKMTSITKLNLKYSFDEIAK